MEHYYQLFMKVILKETEKFQLNTELYSIFLNQLSSSFDQNFDVPYNRCAFVYKYGAINTYFFKECVTQFLLDYQNSKDFVSEWKSSTDLKVCSFSIGPGLDYLAFVQAILEYDPILPNFTDVKIFSQHGAWRNTVQFLLDVLNEQGSLLDIEQSKPKFESVDVIQADFLKYFSGKSTLPSLSDVNIVLMVKTLNVKTSGSPEEGGLLQMLMVLISSLRYNATIFCVDTKPSIALFTQAFLNFTGRFLYGPLDRNTMPSVDFPVVYGTRPTISARGVFFVWQKLEPNISTSHLIRASVNTGSESDLKVASDSADDISSLSSPCLIGDESKIEDQESVNLPWIELKTFWKTSSLQTKKLLKELMNMDKKTLENVEHFILQSEKVDNERNVPLNIKTETDCAELPFSQNLTPQNIKKPKNITNDCSNTLVRDSSFNDCVRNLSIATVSSANCPIYENISPDTIEVNSSVFLTGEKQSNYSARTKIDSIKTKSDSEEHTATETNAAASFHEKAIFTNSCESPSSTSLKELTDYIRQLASSLESMTKQNEVVTDHKICNGSPNNNHSRHPFVPNCNIHDMPSCSKYSSSYGTTEKNHFSDCAVKNKAFQCSDCYFRCQCCHNRCTMQQQCCHFNPCSQSVPKCLSSCSRVYSKGHLEDITSPSIVIPLQNISENLLLKIVAVLKSDSK